VELNHRLKSDKRIEKDVEASGRVIILDYSGVRMKGLEKSTKNLRTVGIRKEIKVSGKQSDGAPFGPLTECHCMKDSPH
jgi:hypothetical protein